MGYLMGEIHSISPFSQIRKIVWVVRVCCIFRFWQNSSNFISQSDHFTKRAPKTVNGDGNNVPHVARPKGAALGRVRPRSLIFRLTGLKKRRDFAGVLRRLLRSFHGAHGCHNPNLSVGISVSQVDPQKNRQKKMAKITPVPTKAPLWTCWRLLWLEDAGGAICKPPSWGNVIGNEQPGAPGSSSEWSRGESSCCGEREGPGRRSMNLRELSETSRRRVIKERQRPPYARAHTRVSN